MTNFGTKSRHHFRLTSPSADSASGLASGDVIGYICEEVDGIPFYKEIDGQYLVDLYYTSQADQIAKNPQEELLINLVDYRSGFGLDVQDYNQLKRYLSSFGADLRFKNRAMLSYGATAITVPQYSVVTIVNADMELTTGWTGGARDTGQAHGGTYSWLLNNASAYQDLATWDTQFRSKRVYHRTWAWCASGSTARISINDGVGTSYSSYHAGTSAWVQLTAQRTMDASATRYRIQFHSDAANNAYFDDDTQWCPTTGTCGRGIDFNDLHYIPIGNVLYKLDATATGLTYAYTLPTTITSLAVMTISGTDYLFIGQGLSNVYWYMTTAESFVESTASNNTMQYLTVYNTTTPTIAGNDTNSTIRTTVNPLNGGTAWSAQTQVDKDFYNITGLHTQGGTLYIPKEDTVYYLDSSGDVQADLAPELLPLKKSTDNGKNAVFFKDFWYWPWGEQSLLETGATNDFKSPALYCTNQSEFAGQVFAATADDMYLWLVTDNSTKVEVLAARREVIDGSTEFTIHPYQEITLAGCNAAWVSSFYRKSLYIASTDSTQNLYYIPLPIGYGNIEADANRSFATGGNFETPYLHGRFPGNTKGWLQVIGTLSHAYDADIYWQIQYKKLEDSSYTNIGNMVGTATDRTHSFYIPVDGSSNNPVSTMMRFKLIGVTDDTTKTPVLLNLNIRALLSPTRKDIIWAKVRVAKEQLTKDGISVDLYAKRKACLEACRNATYPVTLTDIDGTITQVIFLELSSDTPWKEVVANEQGRDYEYIYNLLMLKTPTS